MAVTANRKDFMIDKLIDIVLSWTDDIDLAIQEMVDEGIQPNELLDYFDANTIVEALSNNEVPPEIAAISEKEKVEEIFDNADTLPEKSELIESETNQKSKFDDFTDEEIFLEYLDRFEQKDKVKIEEEFDEDTGEVCERYYTFDPEPFDSDNNLVEGTTITYGFSEVEEYKGCII